MSGRDEGGRRATSGGGDRAAGRHRPLLRMLLLLRLAGRNTLRQTRRSLLTASAMALGLALLMISRAISDGAHDQWIDDGVRLGPGHVSLQAPGHLESGSLSDRLDGARVQRAEQALRAPDVAPLVSRVAERLQVSGLASSPGSAVPVQVIGVQPRTEAGFSDLAAHGVAGRYLEEGDRLAAYIGSGLAERLGLHLGSRFVLTAQGGSGEIADQLVRVVGVFRTGIPEMDDGLVHVPLRTARQWLGTPDGATAVAVLLHSARLTDRVVRKLRARVDASQIRVLPWQQAAPELDSAVRIDNYGDYVFHAILFGIIALAVLNAVLMSVLNRSREFGVLRALGLTRRETGGVVFTEGVLLTALSGGVGTILGFAVTWIFWRHGLDMSSLYSGDLTVSGSLIDPVIIPEFRLVQVLQSLAFIAVIGVLASLYPARQAMRIDVAEAMKFDR